MKFNARYLFALIPILIIGGIIYFLSDIVTYILIAWVISMVGAPVVVFLRRFVGKTSAALITLSIFVLGFLLLIWIFVPPLVSQVENLSKVDYTKVVSALEEPIKDWKNWLIDRKLMIETDTSSTAYNKNIGPQTQDNISHYILLDTIYNDNDSIVGFKNAVNVIVQLNQNDQLNSNIDNNLEDPNQDFFVLLNQNITKYLDPTKIQSMFSSTFNAFGNVIIGVFSIFFIGFFFLKEQGLFDNILTALVPSEYEVQTKQAVDETSKLLIRYFIGILFQVIIITVIVSVALGILGSKNALLIGFFAALMNVIPYIGPIIGAAFAVTITLSSNLELPFYSEMMPLITKVLLVFAFMQAIDNILIQPNIFSKSVKAHPLEIFIIVLVGAKIGGILGMVLAIPFYTAFRVIGKVFLSEFKVIQKLTRHM